MKTVGDCWRLYEKNHIPSTVNPGALRAYWGRLVWFDDLQAGGLSPMEVKAYCQYRKEAGVQAGTINRELAILRAALRHAERYDLIEKAPYIKSLPKPPPKMITLNRDEAKRMIKAADEKGSWLYQVYIRLALGTGQRTSAILDLQWERVDQENKVLDFKVYSDDKSHRMKRRAVVPMNDTTAQAIKIALRHQKGPYVINNQGKRLYSPREMVAKMAKWAGLESVTPHVLRHTVASILLQEDEDLLKVSRLLGHASTVITQQVYFQHPPSWLKNTAAKLKF